MKLPPHFKFVYLKDPEYPNHKVTAIGYVRVKGANGDDYHVQIARCRAPDNFCRRIARKIIEGRYRKYGPVKKYMAEAFPTPYALYEQLDFDWNPETGNELTDAQFALSHDE